MSEESSITDYEQGKIQGKQEMLEWLEKEFGKRLFALIKQYGEWKKNLGDSIGLGDCVVTEWHIREMIKDLISAAKKQASEK
jgi:ribosome-binding protein aMBF1 (putative translation factor)